jgi:hypothetical protein
MQGTLKAALRKRIPEAGILANAIFLVFGYYYLTILRAELPNILPESRQASMEVWGSMLYIFDVLLLVTLIIQLVIFFGRMLVVKIGLESQ